MPNCAVAAIVILPTARSCSVSDDQVADDRPGFDFNTIDTESRDPRFWPATDVVSVNRIGAVAAGRVAVLQVLKKGRPNGLFPAQAGSREIGDALVKSRSH
jgi:hypothetical protein